MSFFLREHFSNYRMEFNPQLALEALREEAQIKRKRHYYHSRLDRFAHELILLRQAGARPVELQAWLRKQRLKVSLSTVTRWLLKNENRSS